MGHRLQAARVRAGLTQQALCQKANISYSTLTKIERGAISSPSIFTIQSVAAALGVGLDELMGRPASPGAHQKLRSKSGVRFVFFDINGCLVRFFHGAFTLLSAHTGASPDAIESIFWHYNDRVCRGEMSMQEFNHTLATQLHTAPLDWRRYYLDSVEPMPGMQELVAWVADRYEVGLLTNIMPGLVDGLQDHGFIPRIAYSAIVDSSKVGAIKPEEKMYEIAASQAHVPAPEILLVDDARINIMAAEKQGWHVLWFDDYHPENSIDRIKTALEPA